MTTSAIGWPLRVWFFVELFFAVSATISVAWHPALTASNFAWTIQPEVMAATIGAFYAALAPVMVLAIFVRRWEMARVFVLPGMAFTYAQLIVTLLHWDRFAVWTGPFNIWFASYLLPPLVFLGCYLWQQRRAEPMSWPAPLAAWQRRGLLALGALFTLEAVIGLVWPAWFTAWAPWRITTLNARALAGYFLLLGLLMLSMARENDPDRVRLVSPFLILLLPVLSLQIARFPEQVDWRHPRLALSAMLLAAGAGRGGSRARGRWATTLGGAAGPRPTL